MDGALKAVNTLIRKRDQTSSDLDAWTKAHDDVSRANYPSMVVRGESDTHNVQIEKVRLLALIWENVDRLKKELTAIDTKIARMADIADE